MIDNDRLNNNLSNTNKFLGKQGMEICKSFSSKMNKHKKRKDCKNQFERVLYPNFKPEGGGPFVKLTYF